MNKQINNEEFIQNKGKLTTLNLLFYFFFCITIILFFIVIDASFEFIELITFNVWYLVGAIVTLILSLILFFWHDVEKVHQDRMQKKLNP